MISVAIVEDEYDTADTLAHYLDEYSKNNGVEFSITHFPTGDEFLSCGKNDFDIVLLDIQMPGTDGMATARRLRERDNDIIIIFVTNLRQFALGGYEVSALDFVVKPVTYGLFSLKISRAVDKLRLKSSKEITVNLGDSIRRIPVMSLMYIEIVGHSLVYHTVDGNFKTYNSLKKAEQELDNRSFVRCNSCYLVNLHYVSGVDGYTVFVGSDKLQMSRAKKKEFVTALNQYIGGSL